MPTINEVGEFVDSVAGKVRTPAAVAGRLIEEVVELCLATGMDNNTIMGHVMDSVYNQTGKASRRSGMIIYPSYMPVEYDKAEATEEAADVALILKDFCHVAGVDIETAQQVKWDVFITRKFNVSDTGTLYAIK